MHDEEVGRIANDASRTLQTYCLRGHCPLWPTKIEPGEMPAALPGELGQLIERANALALDAANGYALDRTEVSVLEYDAHKIRQIAESKVQHRPRDEKGRPILTPDDPAYQPDGPPGDGSAIDW